PGQGKLRGGAWRNLALLSEPREAVRPRPCGKTGAVSVIQPQGGAGTHPESAVYPRGGPAGSVERTRIRSAAGQSFNEPRHNIGKRLQSNVTSHRYSPPIDSRNGQPARVHPFGFQATLGAVALTANEGMSIGGRSVGSFAVKVHREIGASNERRS